ncbi:hypothetical protein [Sphingomonas abietis]|uniref:Uncharacterized protein n=1 Tax=Sphingomonas abietis TaxID=3012344 RepID=A0ABY7NRP9_9SPHN|nr:hypothetical protein [Sphingomonas abietis]WBO23645.1 hypothetical protein PBT88_05855 [Sphingomonas abietis]
MKFVLPLLVGMAGIALIGAARPIVSFEEPPVDPVAVQVMAVYAQCVVARDPAEARTLLAADYTTDAYKKAVRTFALSHRDCVPRGGKLRFNQIVFAGDMAEAVMKRQGVTAQQIEQKASVDHVDTMPRCVIKEKAGDVWALLASKPASRDEQGRLAALQDTQTICAPKDKVVAANPVAMRARLALATYRLLNDPAPTSAGN